MMKKIFAVIVVLTFAIMLAGCGKADSDRVQVTDPEAPAFAENEDADEKILTDELALDAIKSYCFENNPDLQGIVDDETYPVYWSVESSDEHQIVVLYRSYTAAQVRYYIDRASGDTYVTEFVPEITPEEERTDESFNVWDHMPAEQAADEFESTDHGMDYTDGNINIGVCLSDSTNVEITSLEIRYLNFETGELIEGKMIQPVDVHATYDIGIPLEKLDGANEVAVEYIVNGDTERAWQRNYASPDCGVIMNVISYIEEEERFDSVVCG